MKKALLIASMVLVAQAAALAHAAEPSLNVLLAGGAEANPISIALSPDGRSYEIESIAPLEVGGDVCSHPEGKENELLCEAASIAGFEVNAGGGDDVVNVARAVAIPVTLRGGPGNDKLLGGAGADKLIGGAVDDVLVGRAGNDSLFGGPGNDRLIGGSGDDALHGEAGEDVLVGGTGQNELVP
jgi:RTX calcium-binding nonapeptide repeat (4 copies)